MKLLQELAAAQAAQRPEAAAVADGPTVLSYGGLEALANRLARLLQEAGVRPGDRVALLLPKSALTIAAILATLKADAVYVPIDTKSPVRRAARMLRACEPRVVLASRRTAPLLAALAYDRALGSARVGWMEQDAADAPVAPAFHAGHAASMPDGPPAWTNGPDALAYILFTSGSTGEPKGVPITHANVMHFVRWAIAYFGIQPGERLSGHAPLHFDLSTFDVYGSFAAGATLYPVPTGLSLLPHKLLDWVERNELTQWFSVPSLLAYVDRFDLLRPGDLPSLRRLLWCGEVFARAPLARWMQRLPHVTFTNLYGPTEATVASSYHTLRSIPREEEDVPIGRACDGEELLVLDESLQPVAPGTIGDLYIAGVGLSPGYWRDEAKTREAFLELPAGPRTGLRVYRTGDLARVDDDGLVHFVGRIDSLIKSRGYRIELGEIEEAVYTISGIRECAVVGLPTEGFEGTAIACAYSAAGGAEPLEGQLRAALAQSLPDYMLPTRWLRLEKLPTNPNGKIDRRRVRELLEA